MSGTIQNAGKMVANKRLQTFSEQSCTVCLGTKELMGKLNMYGMVHVTCEELGLGPST